jgi:hypothetical protein
MTSRYDNIPTKTNESKKQVTKPVLYPSIPRAVGDIYVQTSPADRLDLIAYKYYGSPGYYWILAEANGIGKGSMNIPVGMQLRIPQNLTEILREYQLLNT